MKDVFFLESDRLKFRSWQESDLHFAEKLWGNREVTKFILSNGPLRNGKIRERLELEIANEKKFGVQYWPFFLKETGEFVGACGLKPYKLFDGIFELGVHICPEFWGNGLGYEACSEMIQHSFNTLNIKSIFAGHNPQNQVSSNLLKKLGFRFTHYEYYPPTELNHPSYILNFEEQY